MDDETVKVIRDIIGESMSGNITLHIHGGEVKKIQYNKFITLKDNDHGRHIGKKPRV